MITSERTFWHNGSKIESVRHVDQDDLLQDDGEGEDVSGLRSVDRSIFGFHAQKFRRHTHLVCQSNANIRIAIHIANL